MEKLIQLDGNCLLFIQEHLRFDGLTEVMKFFTMLGNAGWFWIAITLVLLIKKKTRPIGVGMGISLLLGFLTTNIVLKNLIARPRPYTQLPELIMLIEKPHDWSFPSGHTTASFAGAFLLYRMTPKYIGVSALVLAGIIAYTRLYLGVHYPTDILAGVVVAFFASKIAYIIVNKKARTSL